MKRDRGTVRLAESALSAAIGRSGFAAAAPAQEQAGRHPGCTRSADRNLRKRSPGRYPDLAILLLAFASGGRRRSEVARLRVEQLRNEPPAPVDPRDAGSPTLPCLAIQLGRTKTRDADEEGRVLLVGPPVEALREWLERADIKKGPIFCAIDRWEAVEEKALTPQSINLIVKRRCGMAGLEPDAFSAHGLRAGYLTEAARQGVALPEAMQQSQHRSVQQAASYYNDTERAQGRAARLAI